MPVLAPTPIDAYIKEIALEIDEHYKFDNSPSDKDNKKIFIGRTVLMQKFFRFLRDNKGGDHHKGVYLVTGYRGMGKTSFVNAVVEEYCKENNDNRKNDMNNNAWPGKKKHEAKIEKIEINLAQKQPHEIDILKSMVSRVYHKYKEFFEEEKKIDPLLLPRIKSLWTLAAFGFLLLLLALFIAPNAIECFFTKYCSDGMSRGMIISKIAVPALMLGCLGCRVVLGWRCLHDEVFSCWDRIENIYRRCYTPMVVEKSRQNEFSFSPAIAKMGLSEKETVTFPLASSKEIEFELSQFLYYCKKINFIFVFDELDKIESAAISTSYAEDATTGDDTSYQAAYLQQLRDRKQAIINIIASLKNMLTTANARFIFIAGREMFDASLADVADRQSSLGSIFSYVFYIDSFLKEVEEGVSNKAALGGMIEKYLCGVLFGKKYTENGDRTNGEKPQTLYDLIISRWNESTAPGETKDDRSLWKTIVMLQSFIVYVTYRSNGSPKKIIKTIHEFIRVDGDIKNNQLVTSLKEAFIFENKTNTKGRKAYLLFDFTSQYRIGFINHLYLPFLVKHGHNYKKYSDNILISTSYLFDHLLKFHPFAFSVSNLELIPEVLATNKTPSLREYILTIIDYLSNSHVRETEIGIFDYKYYSRTMNELSYISKEFEEESAAFNFTLDEAYLVKLHIRNELRETREVYKNNGSTAVFPKTHLYGILGDLHFFDQEYDDAIVAYSGAIHGINEGDETSLVDFVTLINFKLRLGLCFEKRKSYEEALSFYTEACEQTKKYIGRRLVQGEFMDIQKEERLFQQPTPGIRAQPAYYHSSVLSDLLQIVNQAFLAKIILQEKMGIEGITQYKFSVSIGGFLKLAEAIEEICGRNHLIHANFYLILGNLLYFKNSPRGFEHETKIKDIYSASEYAKFKELLDRYEYLNQDNQRKPILALFFYCIGIVEVLKSKGKLRLRLSDLCQLRHTKDPNPVKDILAIVENDRLLKENIYTRNHYKYIAGFLSNIGDCILGTFRIEGITSPIIEKKYYTHSITALFDKEKLKGGLRQYSFVDLLLPVKDDKLQLSDVLRCYYWSAFLYKRRGRMVSYSFQLRKVLYVLRLLLKEDNGDVDKEIINNFIHYLNTLIVEPILSVASHTSEQADKYIQNKYDTIFKKLSPTLPGLIQSDKKEEYYSRLQEYMKNNSCNHPDIREANSLFYYIKIKLGCEDKNYSDFLNPFSSFATQYTRIFELEFWHKYHAGRLNKMREASGMKEADYWRKLQKENDAAYWKHVNEFLYCMFSKLLIFEVYGIDYMIGHSFQAYTHYQLALFLKSHGYSSERLVGQLNTMADTLGYNICDPKYNFEQAKFHYEKAIQLHTGGQEYKKNMDNIIYLEDDINDNAYHFGAALDRYMLVNLVFDAKVSECEEMIRRCGAI